MANATMPCILVVDDDHSSLSSLQDVLQQAGYLVITAQSGVEALERLTDSAPNLIITDLRMREIDGMKLLETVRKTRKDLPVIVMTAFTSMETAIEAIRNGAYDYISKPFKLDHLRMVVSRALEQAGLLKENRLLRNLVEEQSHSEVIGRSPEMVEIYKIIGRVAPLRTTVLIQGESGTGKEVIARLLYKNSGQTGPFLAVNCGALAEGLLESELFGHVKGAFTGAVANKVGIFEAAQEGTCFLDEISNTSVSLQMKLLRVLEERVITRVGSTEVIPVNARVIAATNQPLEDLVRARKFREDLFYRLKVVTVNVPPLRERRADIPLLLDFFVRRHAKATSKEIAIQASVYDFLSAYPWPGNVRELAHAVERAIALNSSGIITREDFPDQSAYAGNPGPKTSAQGTLLMSMAEKEKEYILEVLDAVHQNVSKAAEILDIDRRTLYRILERHHVALRNPQPE
ncbi:MAG: sigma-54-dependent Fis family transcriptional regulator [Candidatus Firestonebacteria bacterium]|nr:sigma-54-dependent Fis family transcriptional regulator [Candidatus Firestonebacteria bacterium]